MADNVAYTEGAGTTIAADEIAAVKYQRVKIVQGADGVNDGDVASGNPLPVSGAVTANAGTNLNTSALALEAGGNLAGAATSLAVIDDWDESDRAKVNPIAGQAGVQGGSGAVSALTQRVVLATDVALPTGANAIGKLAANSGVDIGDVDVTSISAGTNAIGNIGVIPRTTGGLTTYHLVSAGSTNATVVKASAGQLFGWYIYNNNAAMRKVAFHNAASTPTAGASIFFTLNIPGAGAANVFLSMGIAFSTGISLTTVTDNTDAGATGVASGDLTINLFYA